MKRLVVVAVALAALALPVVAAAHPLGNFTVNRFSRVEVAGPRVYVHYVLDLAEIPTFQAGNVDARTYARRIAHSVRLTVDGRRARLVPMEMSLVRPIGAAGLRTTRFELILRGPALSGPTEVTYRDTNYAGRLGWKEIVVGDAPSASNELRSYPRGVAPADVTHVRASLVPGSGTESPPELTGPSGARHEQSSFAALVARDDLGVWVILASLAAALFWGAVHALSPGHGKTIVTAYLVGQRGTVRHAALLGLIVTATHTVGVFALGLVTLLLSQYIVPDDLYPWLNLIAGVFVVAIGVSVLRARLRPKHHHHHHDLSPRSLLAVGVSGGLLPCPSALVVLLASISLHRVAYGMLLVVAFSAGLALTITGIGLVAVLARGAFRRLNFNGRLGALLPAASALVILAAGLAMTVHALPKVR